MKLSTRKAIGVCMGALMGVGLAATITLSAKAAEPAGPPAGPAAGAPPAGGGAGRGGARRTAPSPAVPAPPLTAFTKVKNPKAMEGVWLIYSGGGNILYTQPPLSKAGEAKIATFRAKYNEADLKANPPNSACVEPGMPAAMSGIGLVPMDIHMDPQRITLISEVGPITRRIFLDPKRTAPDGFPPSPVGWSNGHWEGDTLVVTTSLMSEWLLGRWSHTEDAVLTERFTLRNSSDFGTTVPRNQPLDPMDPVSPETLVLEISMHDPALYDVDPKSTLYYRHMKDDEFNDISCVEGLFWETMNNKWRKRDGDEAPAAAGAAAPTGGGRGVGTLLQSPARVPGGGRPN